MSETQPHWLQAEQEEIWRDWLAAVAWITRNINCDLQPYGINLDEYEVLVNLSEAPNRCARMSVLAEQVNQSRSRLTHTINRMERDGYVERSIAPEDRRGVIAHLTDEGYDLIREIAPEHLESVRHWFIDQVDDDDFTALGRAMKAVLAQRDDCK